MPPAHTAVHEASFRRALKQANAPVFLFGEVDFQAFKNLPAQAFGDPENARLDRDSGDNTACVLSALVTDFPGGLPSQGESFTDADENIYRVERITRTPGQPIVNFHCANVVPAAS